MQMLESRKNRLVIKVHYCVEISNGRIDLHLQVQSGLLL